MYRWVHRIGANRTLEQLVDARGRREFGRELVGTMEMIIVRRDLVVFHPVRRSYALNVVKLHRFLNEPRKPTSEKSRIFQISNLFEILKFDGFDRFFS